MARLLTVGFELQSATSAIEWETTTGSPTINTSIVRSGSASLRANPSAAAWYIQDTVRADTNTDIYARMAIYIATAPSAKTTIMAYGDSANFYGAVLRLGTDRKLYADSGTGGFETAGTTALNTAQWYVLTFYYNEATNKLTSKIDGVTEHNAVTVDDVGGGGRFRFGIQTATTADIYIDDIAVNDTTGASENAYPDSAGKVIRLLPDSAGDVNAFSTQTGGTAGSANNFTRVDEVTPDDATTFNADNTLNNEDSFGVGASGIGGSDTVNVVHIGARFANDVADATTTIKFEVEKTSAGTITQSAAIKPNSVTWRTNSVTAASIATHPITLYKDPDSASWTQSTLDTMQVGYKITTGGVHVIRVTDIWATVDYTVNTGTTTSTSTSTSTSSTSSSTSTSSTSSSTSSTSSSSSTSSTSTSSTSSSSSSSSTSSTSTSSTSTSTTQSGTTTSSSSSSTSSTSSSTSSTSTSSTSTSHSTSSSSTSSTSTSTSSTSSSSSSSTSHTTSSSSSSTSTTSSSTIMFKGIIDLILDQHPEYGDIKPY